MNGSYLGLQRIATRTIRVAEQPRDFGNGQVHILQIMSGKIRSQAVEHVREGEPLPRAGARECAGLRRAEAQFRAHALFHVAGVEQSHFLRRRRATFGSASDGGPRLPRRRTSRQSKFFPLRTRKFGARAHSNPVENRITHQMCIRMMGRTKRRANAQRGGSYAHSLDGRWCRCCRAASAMIETRMTSCRCVEGSLHDSARLLRSTL